MFFRLHSINRHIVRGFHTSGVISSATQSPLFQLRQRTGLAYNLCREALNKHENNIDEAESWLKAHALAHGLQKATKVRSRSAKEGLIGLATHIGNRRVTLVELNCETDFVAKNQYFKEFAINLTENFASSLENCEAASIPNLTKVRKLHPAENLIKDADALIAPLITRLGENIKIHRVFHIETTEDDTRIFSKIHSHSGQQVNEQFSISTGRFGAVVALQVPMGRDLQTLNPVGGRLCQHIIGYSPTYIELPDNIRRQLEASEKERAENLAAERDGRPEDEHASDREQEDESSSSKDDWPSIMDQNLIMSDDTSIRDFCKEQNINIIYFDRFECGADT